MNYNSLFAATLMRRKTITTPICNTLNIGVLQISIKQLILTLLMSVTANAAVWADNVTFINAGGQSQTVDATVVTSETTSMGTDGQKSWYVVSSDVTVESRIVTNGTVNLILADGYTLTANSGIKVQGSTVLNIYCQSGKTGTLIATAGNSRHSGIGSNYDYGKSGGTINIYGGNITAKGGIHDAGGGAGIGGGDSMGKYTVNIFGGTINATGGSYAAGIGGGCIAKSGSVSIYGGTINATGGNGTYAAAPGIGAANSSETGCTVTIRIEGGKINAVGGVRTGENNYKEPGIGRSKYDNEKMTANISLDWCDSANDEIFTNAYGGTVTLASSFKEKDNPENVFAAGTVSNNNSLAGKTIVPNGTNTTTSILASVVELTGGDTFSYTGSQICPTVVSLTVGGTTITDLSGFDIEYPEVSTDVGTYNITITPKASNSSYKHTATKSYTITKVDATLIEAPTPVDGTCYIGQFHTLVTEGSASGGTMQYSTDGINFSANLPQASVSGNYTVYYKVKGDKNHNDVTPDNNSVTATVEFIPAVISGLTYNEEGGYYEIPDTAALNVLSAYVNAGNQCLYHTFKLTNDISYDPTINNNFTPIGFNGKYFKGTLDGDHHTVNGVRISVCGFNAGVGLIGALGDGGCVKDINANNFVIIGTLNGSLISSGLAAIVGDKSGGTITGCTVSNSTISAFKLIGAICGSTSNYSGSITNCTVIGCNIIADDKFVGGITGNNPYPISGCTVISTIISGSQSVGGISGSGENSINNCQVADCTIKGSGGVFTGVITGHRVNGTVSDCVYQNNNGVLKGIGHNNNGDNDNGCTRVYAVHCDEGVTATYVDGDTVNISNLTFYKSGATFTVSHAESYEGGTFNHYAVIDGVGNNITATALNGTTLTINDSEVTVKARWNVSADHFALNGDVYTIYDVKGWNHFCNLVEDGETFSGKTVKLADSFDNTATAITTMAGTSANKFCGTFDGNGKTLNVALEASANDCAPFRYVDGATIKKLTITGTITTSKKYAASIAAHTYGETHITNCRSTATITGTIYGDGMHGGFVGVNEGNATLRFDNCVFKGKMLGSGATSNGGFVGYNSGTQINYTDCFFAPTELTRLATSSSTFNRNGKNVFTRCYYTTALGTEEGTHVYPAVQSDFCEKVTLDGSDYYTMGTTVINAATQYYSNGSAAITITPSITYEGTVLDANNYTTTITKDGNVITSVIDKGCYVLTIAGVNSKGYYGSKSMTFYVLSDLSGNGTEQSPYLINDSLDWERFTSDINNGINADKYYKISDSWNDNENVFTTMVGTSTNKFCGTFDGNGKTLTIELTSNGEYTAPFRYVNGAKIYNLFTTGTITSSSKYASGLIGEAKDTVEVSGCKSSVTIISSVNGDGTHGGFVGVSQNSTTITGCVFNGVICCTSSGRTTSCGGFVGWKNNTLNIDYNLYAPADIPEGKYAISTSNSSTFARNYTMPSTAHNYYTDVLGTAQGVMAHSTDILPTNIGEAGNDYGIVKAYDNGLLYNDRYYMTPEAVSLAGNAANNVAAKNGYFATVTLADRTLYKDGAWNTICLPFEVSLTDENSPLNGTTAKKLEAASVEGTTLKLTFGNVVETLEAGVPYIIKWNEGNNIVNPVFADVTITEAEAGSASFTANGYTVEFLGTYSPTELETNTASNLYFGSANKLMWPDEEVTLGSCRAYFKIDGETAGAKGITSIDLIIDDEEEATAIISTTDCTDNTDKADAWYTVSGIRLDGKPSNKGMYIHNGKTVVIE